jgi:RNA polymerase sigma-70 factor (ECF subfamily)
MSTVARATEAAVDDLLYALVQEHARFLFKVAYAVLRHRHDAEDAVQETYLRVLQHRRELPDVEDMRAWLARIAWRIALDLARQRKRGRGEWPGGSVRRNLEDPGTPCSPCTLISPAPGAEQAAIGTQMLEVAERLLAGLPRELRDVLTLSAVEELKSPEVGAILGIPEVSVRTRLFRARQLLQEKMAALLG